MSDTQARKAALKLGSLQDQEIADLLAKIFHPDSQQRPTAREALAELKKWQALHHRTISWPVSCW
jgi:hypothetical protein